MEDGGGLEGGAVWPLETDSSTANNHEFPRRPRSGSTTSGHRRSLSGSLLSKLSFLRMTQATATQIAPDQDDPRDDVRELDGELSPTSTSSTRPNRAMSSAIQQQRRTRRRRGSLRKTALLGTRMEAREKRAASLSKAADLLRTGHAADAGASSSSSGGGDDVSSVQRTMDTDAPRVSLENESTPRGSLDHLGTLPRAGWAFLHQTQPKPIPASHHRTQSSLSKGSVRGDELTDDEDEVSLRRIHNANTMHSSSASASTGTGSGLHLPTPSSSSDSYFATQLDPTTVSRQTSLRAKHRAKSPLATTEVNSAHAQSISMVDYSETEWWGWIILIVTWLIFVVGMGSCFGVWSWAWDVGETPYAPPELEDDPTLPIVGYYPALIVMTAVMSWVWVVVAWVGMKYFKHANIAGDEF